MSDVPSLEWSAREGAAEEILAERLAGWQERYPDVNVRRLVVWDQAARRLLNESESAQLVVVSGELGEQLRVGRRIRRNAARIGELGGRASCTYACDRRPSTLVPMRRALTRKVLSRRLLEVTHG